ncbi:MAG: putative bifunctional diguanylate cyclase/phosphodiesterase [Caulobacteraceae bacterium]
MAAGLAALVALMRRQARAERLAATLSGAAPLGRPSLPASLSMIAERLEATAHRAVNTNPITSLPTREALAEQIAADVLAGRQAHLLGVIRFCDFDRIAAFDHLRAAEALRAFSQRLSKATRPSHLICQIDRDCFCIYFRAASHLDAARAELGAIVYVAAQEMSDEYGVITPNIEVGAVAAPTDIADIPQVLLRIIAALDRPLASKRGEVAVIASPSAESSREAFLLEQDLVRAIAEDQLTMFFQPVVDVSTGRLIAAEALLRWEHPTLGFVSPAHFIPIVEAMGMGEKYGLWVLNAACQQARAWQDHGLNDLKVAVNLSARQLADAELKAKIERTLQRHDLEPCHLELELTETAAMADAARTRQLFSDLREAGVTLAIDDFGSGYSSLSYLKNLPFNKLKIDREFITDVHNHADSQAICKALIELGRGLNLKILAEGVETEAEVDVLRRLGCNIFQGYYFSRPLSASAFIDLASSSEWAARLEHLSGADKTGIKAPLVS